MSGLLSRRVICLRTAGGSARLVGGLPSRNFRQPVKDLGLRFLDQAADFKDLPAQVTHPRPYLVEAFFAFMDHTDDLSEALHCPVHRKVIHSAADSSCLAENLRDPFRQPFAHSGTNFSNHGDHRRDHRLEAPVFRPPRLVVFVHFLLQANEASMGLVGSLLDASAGSLGAVLTSLGLDLYFP